MKLKKVLSGFMAAVIAVTSSVVMTVSSSAATALVDPPTGLGETVLATIIDPTQITSDTYFVLGSSGSLDLPTLATKDNIYLKLTVTDYGNINNTEMNTYIGWGYGSYNWISLANIYRNWGDNSYYNDANNNGAAVGAGTMSFVPCSNSTNDVAYSYIPFNGFPLDEYNECKGNIQPGHTSEKPTVTLELVEIETDTTVYAEQSIDETSSFSTEAAALLFAGEFDLDKVNGPKARIEITVTPADGAEGAGVKLVGVNNGSVDYGTVYAQKNADHTAQNTVVFNLLDYTFASKMAINTWGVGSIDSIKIYNDETKGNVYSAAVAPATYSVSVSDTIENGTVTAEPTEAAEGETVTLTATPDEGYVLDTLTVTGASGAVTVTDNKFTMPAEEVTVSATFKAIDYTLTAAAADGGSIYFEVDGNRAETANVGDAVYVIIEADDYYNLSSATANGVPVEACLFEMPAENVIVTPVFELDIEELKTDVDAALTSAILEATQPSAYTVANLNTAIVNALAEINEAVALTVDTSALTLKASTEETTGAITGTVTIKTGDTTVTTATANVTLNKIPANPVEVAYEAIVAYLETVTFDNDFHATNQSEAITALVTEKAPGARVNPNFNVIVADYENAGAVKGTIEIVADGYEPKTITVNKVIAVLEKTDEMLLEDAVAATETAIKDIATADGITKDVVTKAIANEDVTVTVKSEETKAPTTTEKGVQTVTITLTVGDVTETITKTFDIDMLPAGYQDAANTTIPEGKTVTQKTAVEDGVYSQRFIKKVAAKDLVGATKIVFTVSNGTKTATYESTKCYSSLNVNGGSLSAGDDYVFLGLTIKDIPENITVTIEDIEIVY